MRLPKRSRIYTIQTFVPPVITSKQLIVATVALLGASAILAVLNFQRTRGLQNAVVLSETARQNADQQRAARETQLKDREAAVAAASAKFGDIQTKIASTEGELTRVQAERNDLQAKLRANETAIADLRARIENGESKSATNPSPAISTDELQAQLDDAKKQLDAAEHEKILLSDKLRLTQEKSAQFELEKKQRRPGQSPNPPAIRGTVLAVNQAYNFVVLSLGAREGVEANTEMLVLRGGSFIGRIRISSVEPATAIGDIITSTLARGVQVQPGDIVVYAGNNS
jgi:hypothetical protein